MYRNMGVELDKAGRKHSVCLLELLASDILLCWHLRKVTIVSGHQKVEIEAKGGVHS